MHVNSLRHRLERYGVPLLGKALGVLGRGHGWYMLISFEKAATR